MCKEPKFIGVLLSGKYVRELFFVAEDKCREHHTLLPAFAHDFVVRDERMDPENHFLTLNKLEHDLAHIRILVGLLPEDFKKRICVL
jgi:hypothetical protein